MKSLALIAILFLQAGQTGTGVLTGRILGLDGKPAAGVRVALTSPNANGQITADILVAITTTDASGAYHIENVPPGQYGVIAGTVSYPTFYPGVASGSRAKVVIVAPGSTTSELSFAMVTARKAGARPVESQPPLPTGRVFGRVVVEGIPASTNGVPLPPDLSRVWVRLTGEPLDPSVGRESPMTGRGSRVSTKPRDGNFSLMAILNDYIVSAEEVNGAPLEGYVVKSIRMGAIDLMKEKLKLTGSGSGEIVITLAPIQ